MASVFLLSPSTTYHWKASWGSEFRVMVLEGGATGAPIYNVGVPSPRGVYAPNPHYAYLGTPVGRSGAESATIPARFIGMSGSQIAHARRPWAAPCGKGG
jgi:hypothetical protein